MISKFLLSLLVVLAVPLLSHARLSFRTTSLDEPLEEYGDDDTTTTTNNNNDQDHDLNLSIDIPPLKDTLELVRLSDLVYELKEKGATNCSSFPDIYEEYTQKESSSYYDAQSSPFISSISSTTTTANYTLECHMYERDAQDTQVLIVSKTLEQSVKNSKENERDYVAIVFAGTDDFRNALTDTNILTKHFGPDNYDSDDYYTDDQDDDSKHRKYNFPPRSDNIRVHAGFNNAVFKNGLFDRIYDHITSFKRDNPSTRIFTTGHSLGASDAELTAVALKIQDEFKDEDIHSINFGCPKTGTRKWREYVNGLDKLGVWRFVNDLDLIPRLPGVRFHHVGHTVQMNSDAMRGYWLHGGDKSLGYAGVPYGWNTLPYVLAPKAAYEHLMSHYTSYIREKSTADPDTHYINKFETVRKRKDYYDDFATKDYERIDESQKLEIAREYAKQYQFYVNIEHGENPDFLSSSFSDTRVN